MSVVVSTLYAFHHNSGVSTIRLTAEGRVTWFPELFILVEIYICWHLMRLTHSQLGNNLLLPLYTLPLVY